MAQKKNRPPASAFLIEQNSGKNLERLIEKKAKAEEKEIAEQEPAEIIAEREKRLKAHLPTRHELRLFLASVIFDPQIDMRNRLRAAEYLGNYLRAFEPEDAADVCAMTVQIHVGDCSKGAADAESPD